MQTDWANAPTAIHGQVDGLLCALRALLPDPALGVYLHGSMAFGCFNPDRSDIDLLVFTSSLLGPGVLPLLAQSLIRWSCVPAPIEISFISARDLHPWTFPTPFALHFSERWRERFEAKVARESVLDWNDGVKSDADLAAHITVARERGVTLCGQPARYVFPRVPDEDFRTSILVDYNDQLANVAGRTGNALLSMGRVCRYLSDGSLVSKKEAGEWLTDTLPAECTDAITDSLSEYAGIRAFNSSPASVHRCARKIHDRVIASTNPAWWSPIPLLKATAEPSPG